MTDPASRRGPWWAAAEPSQPVGERTCAVCGIRIAFAVHDVPDAGSASICDDCTRAREFDETLWEQDLADPDAGLW